MFIMCRNVVLGILGLIVICQAQTCSKPVAGPNMNLKDEFILMETFQDGSKVSFSCSVGYQSAGGSKDITCTAGTWSPVILKCERKNCGSAGEITNGNIDYPDGTLFGDKVVSSCNTGYYMIGKPEITCGDKGWLDRLPTCEVVTCEPPPAVANGDYSPKKEEVYSYRDVVLYTCITDLTLNGATSSVCSEDGKFKPDPPECVYVNCKEPTIEHGVLTGGSRPPHRHNAFITFKCNPGYVMVGESSVTCGLDSNWSPGIPQCKLMSTTTKATPVTTPTKDRTVPPETTPSGGGNFLNWGIPTIIVIVVGVVVLVVVCVVKKKKSKHHSPVGSALCVRMT